MSCCESDDLIIYELYDINGNLITKKKKKKHNMCFDIGIVALLILFLLPFCRYELEKINKEKQHMNFWMSRRREYGAGS